jgi:hypothetical protein
VRLWWISKIRAAIRPMDASTFRLKIGKYFIIQAAISGVNNNLNKIEARIERGNPVEKDELKTELHLIELRLAALSSYNGAGAIDGSFSGRFIKQLVLRNS